MQGSNWRKVLENNWDIKRQKILCQHLGFEATEEGTETDTLERGTRIVTGDLICYALLRGTSCCIRLKPSVSRTSTKIPNVKC